MVKIVQDPYRRPPLLAHVHLEDTTPAKPAAHLDHVVHLAVQAMADGAGIQPHLPHVLAH